MENFHKKMISGRFEMEAEWKVSYNVQSCNFRIAFELKRILYVDLFIFQWQFVALKIQKRFK